MTNVIIGSYSYTGINYNGLIQNQEMKLILLMSPPKRFYSKDGITEIYYVGHLMIKPIDYKALFDNKIASE